MNGCPYKHVCEVFGGSHQNLRCKQTLNSDLWKNGNFLRVTRLANSILLSLMLDSLSAFFSDEQFSIILAFFESVIFDLSVLMFLFIRVCSVSAISGSLFSK